MTVLLTDAKFKNSLAVLRALAAENIEAYCSGTKKKSIAFYSKFCKKAFLYSNPRNHPEKFKQEMRSFVKQQKIDVLMPIGISAFTLISQDKDFLEKYTKVPVADYEQFEKAHDKATTNKVAKDLKLPIPLTYSPANKIELKQSIKEFSYPIVIKARKGSSTNQVKYARSKDEVIHIWEEFQKMGKRRSVGIIDHKNPILQEYLPGEIVDVVFIFNKGKPRGSVAQRRVLTVPVEGGSGALNETLNDPEVIKQTFQLMKKLKWHGVGMAEFKRDANGIPKLIEINPKFWGTSECAISAGINFPYMLYKIAMDGDVKPNFSYLYPKKFGWPIPMGVKQIMESDTPIESLKEYLKLFAETNSHDIRLLSDPRPFSIQLVQTTKVILNKIIQSRTKKIDIDQFR